MFKIINTYKKNFVLNTNCKTGTERTYENKYWNIDLICKIIYLYNLLKTLTNIMQIKITHK